MIKVIRIDDTAIGHTDIEGNSVIGVVNQSSSNVKAEGKYIARNGDNVAFPSHPHALDEGVPIDYLEHNVAIIANRSKKINGQSIAAHGDVVPVVDGAGPNATLVATAIKTNV